MVADCSVSLLEGVYTEDKNDHSIALMLLLCLHVCTSGRTRKCNFCLCELTSECNMFYCTSLK
jgi:hypothetical protein